MSDPTPPPPDPYGQPNPYGQPAQPNPYGQPAGQNPYGQPADPYGQPVYAPPDSNAYAHWGKRVGAALIDWLLLVGVSLPFTVMGSLVTGDSANGVSAAGFVLSLLGWAAQIGVIIWNVGLKSGRTGYSVGKGVLGIKLVNVGTGQPIGAGMAVLRYFVHIVDVLTCWIGFLWPLWDAKRQTFADKIVSTVVINQPKG